MTLVINASTYCLPLGICCLSIYISLRMMRFPDLGIVGSFLGGAYVYCAALAFDSTGIVAVMLAMVAGACAGALTGLLHFRFGLNSLLAGIISTLVCRSLSARLAIHANPGLEGPRFAVPEKVGVGEILDRFNQLVCHSIGIDVSLIQAVSSILILGLAAWLISWFARTQIGTWLLALGDNRPRAKQLGLPVMSLGIWGLALAGGIAGMGGASHMFTSSTVSMDSANMILTESLAAFFLGLALVSSTIGISHSHRFVDVLFLCFGGAFTYQLFRASTQIQAWRIPFVEATDYSLLFALFVGGLSGYMEIQRQNTTKARPMIIY